MLNVPMGEKFEIRRKFQNLIIDELDFIFSYCIKLCRIAFTSNNHFNLVYYPILNCVKNNIFEIEEIRKKLEMINNNE